MESKPETVATSEFGFELDEIQELINLVESRGLAKLVLEESDRRLVIRGGRADNPDVAMSEEMIDTVSLIHAARPPKQIAPHVKRIALESPMVGVFYRSSSPDSPPLVDVGDHVEIGHAIGVIEAMKVFSEIPSDHAGVVLEIVAKNGELVRQGAPLMYLKGE